MAGLEVLYTCVRDSVTCPQDAVVCFVHWEMIKNGYRCLGSGDEPQSSDRKSELLPSDWSSNKELYSLRYTTRDTEVQLLLKAISVDACLIFNLMDCSTQQVSELTVNIGDHVDVDQLHTFDRVFRDAGSLSDRVQNQLLSTNNKRTDPRTQRTNQEERQQPEDRIPLSSHSSPYSRTPLFSAGGADLDPFGSRSGGGMIVDPLRSGYPRSGFDPSSGIPDILPPGAVPPGARFDPFGPIGRRRPGPDPDHLPPPGYDDMFM